MIVLLLKLVVEEYIRHIGPFDFAIEAVPFIADEERWNRPNWIAIEFNLLYRWHSLVPDDDRGGRRGVDLAGVPATTTRWSSRVGWSPWWRSARRSAPGRIGLLNTPSVPGRPVDAGPAVARGAHHRA